MAKNEGVSADDFDRNRGLLSEVDRKFLAGEKEYAHRQTASDRRAEIKNRVQNAILDFTVLYEHMEEESVHGLLDSPHEMHSALIEGIEDVHAVMLGAVGREVDDSFLLGYEDLASFGMYRGEWKYFDRRSDVDLDIKPAARVNVEKVVQQLNEGGYASISEREAQWAVRTLLDAGELSGDGLKEAWLSTEDGQKYQEQLEASEEDLKKDRPSPEQPEDAAENES